MHSYKNGLLLRWFAGLICFKTNELKFYLITLCTGHVWLICMVSNLRTDNHSCTWKTSAHWLRSLKLIWLVIKPSACLLLNSFRPDQGTILQPLPCCRRVPNNDSAYTNTLSYKIPFTGYTCCYEQLGKLIHHRLNLSSYTLCMERTNWKLGSKDINYLVVAIA